MRLYIFYEVPRHTKMRCIMAPVTGTTTEKVMAPAVAAATKLGYEKLYRLLLEHVSYKQNCCQGLLAFVHMILVCRFVW